LCFYTYEVKKRARRQLELRVRRRIRERSCEEGRNAKGIAVARKRGKTFRKGRSEARR